MSRVSVAAHRRGRGARRPPEIFESDDIGNCATRGLEVPPGPEERAGLEARNCPEKAITVIEN